MTDTGYDLETAVADPTESDLRASIVLATRDRSAIVAHAIESALCLRIVGEVIVVDDGSVDQTSEVLSSFGSDVRSINSGGVGVSGARNEGLRLATFPWVAFLDDDDVLTEQFDDLRPFLQQKDVGVAFGGSHTVLPGEVIRDRVTPAPMGPEFANLTGSVLAGSWIARRSLVSAVGGYAESLADSENTELFLRLAPELSRRELREAWIDDVVLVRGARPTDARRLARVDANRVAAVRYLQEQHEEQLLASPSGYAAQLRVGAVSAARLGERQTARELFRLAARHGNQPVMDHVRELVVSLRLGPLIWPGRR